MKTAMTGRVILAAAALAAAAGVAGTPASATKPESKPATIVTEDSRGLVSARIGDPIEIRLRAQPGTGFSWVPTRFVAGLSEMKPVRASKPMPGSAQFQRFRFVPTARGTFPLSFSYDQPWRGGTKGARKTFLIIVR